MQLCLMRKKISILCVSAVTKPGAQLHSHNIAVGTLCLLLACVCAACCIGDIKPRTARGHLIHVMKRASTNFKAMSKARAYHNLVAKNRKHARYIRVTVAHTYILRSATLYRNPLSFVKQIYKQNSNTV